MVRTGTAEEVDDFRIQNFAQRQVPVEVGVRSELKQVTKEDADQGFVLGGFFSGLGQ